MPRTEVKQKLNSISSLPDHYLPKIDSLLLAKSQLLQTRINNLFGQATDKLRTLDSIPNTKGASFLNENVEYTTRLSDVNQTLETYKSQITDREELAWIEHYTGQLDQLEGVVSEYKDELLKLEELNELRAYRQQLQQLSGEASGYLTEAQAVLQGRLQEDSPLMQIIKSKISNTREFQQLQHQNEALDKLRSTAQDQQKELQQLGDQEYVLQKALEQAKELAATSFDKHQDKIKAAQNKLSALKKKYSSVPSAQDLSTATKRNSMRGKPLSERLELGGTLQVNREPTSVDLSPLVGYKLNKQLTLGAGVTYRAVLDIDEFKTEDQVYGFRAFVQQHAIRGFLVHGEFERLNVALETVTRNDQYRRKWQTNGLIGVGKEYPMFKGIKGQVLVLYNFLHDHGVTPYQKPIVVRVGFVL